MADPLEELHQRLVSQGASNSPLNVQREFIDFSQPFTQPQQPPPLARNEDHTPQQKDTPEEKEDDDETPPPPLPPPPPPPAAPAAPAVLPAPAAGAVADPTCNQKKKRMKMANRKLIAGPDLYLLPSAESEFSNLTTLMEGTVRQCPLKSNGWMFKIDWKRPDGGYPVPTSSLHQIIPSKDQSERPTKYRPIIEKAIELYEEKQKDMPPPPNRTTRPAGGRSTVVRTPLPTVIGADEAAASIRTSSSTVSSLTTNSGSTLPTLTRLNHPNPQLHWDDSDSDEGSDIGQEEDNWEDVEDVREDEIQEEMVSGDCDIGELINRIQWNFEEMPNDFVDQSAPVPYNGPEGNKRGANSSFSDPFECLQQAGLSYEFVARLTENSNHYIRKKAVNNMVDGKPFENIKVGEMYRFLGIMLQISISPKDSGGYPAYFREKNKTIFNLEIPNTTGFAVRYMKLKRFQLIRRAFHPEDKASAYGSVDKCYMLRHAINTFNKAAENLRFVPGHLSFDEGGVSCRSRYCPVRQYNKDKPDKFRVEFFIMACPKKYFIHHLDVYQGKNDKNVGIKPEIRNIRTTQKAVLNAVLSMKITPSPDGARLIAMDNRYQCPELAVILRGKYGIYTVGTCRRNRKGFPADLMDLSPSEPRGTYKLLIDKANNVQCVQWVDSKVVSVVTTKLDAEIGHVFRQVGSEKKRVTCPLATIEYQKNMIGVDKGDQMRAHGGGFSRRAHFKKWYKKVYLAILDCMLLNALVVWNDSVEDGDRQRTVLKRHEFYQYCSERMLSFPLEEDDIVNNQHQQESLAALPNLEGHIQRPPPDNKMKCVVCKLEMGKGICGRVKLSQEGVHRHVMYCPDCRMAAHSYRPTNIPRKIFLLPQFAGMSCYQILHSSEGFGLWDRKSESEKFAYSITTSHPIYETLREMYGRPRKKQRLQRTSDVEEEKGDGDQEPPALNGTDVSSNSTN